MAGTVYIPVIEEVGLKQLLHFAHVQQQPVRGCAEGCLERPGHGPFRCRRYPDGGRRAAWRMDSTRL